MKESLNIPFYEKYLLTVEEATAYFHIGSKKMREILETNKNAKWHLISGKRLMIKKDLFAKWLDSQSII